MTTPPPVAVSGDGHRLDDRPSVRGLGPLLRLAGVRRLAGLRMLASFGDGAFLGALVGSVLFDPSQRSSPADIAAGFAVLLLPYSVVGPFAGALLDRWSRRQVLFWASVVRAGVVGVLAVLLAFGSPLWVLFAAALVVTGTGRFVGSGLSASLPHLVAQDSLVGANSLTTTLGSVSSLVGGSLALGLRGMIGGGPGPTALSCVVVLACYLTAAWVVRRFERRALGPDETDEPRQTVWAVLQGLTAGVAHAWQHRTVGLNITMVVVVRFGVGMSTLVVLLLFQHYFTRASGIFRTGLAGVTEVVSVAGIGIFLGAVCTAPLVRWIGRTRYVVILLVFASLVIFLAGSQFSPPTTMLTALLLSFVYQSSKICADSVVQADSDDAHIGRVFALYDTLNNVLYVAGFAVGAALVPFNGYSMAAVVVVGCVFLASAVGYGLSMRALRPTVHPAL
ncbi:MFS transporter [Nakamurella sp. YIM 132087]|uniref:MFS transporter n=1 Tax=Nakamurella alba TaxID=2665158 RepID=A0A7K1FMB8_9ACTN|nr:MFS transporter [Nakamurella alba]MTD15305.1 MFS transporter [Nakamurella alba]